ncbi:MAG: hydrogenase maturation protease [Oligoflexus sp.]
MIHKNSKRCLICIGNQNRGDDGVALLIARNLQQGKKHSFTIFTQTGEMGELMDTWQGYDEVSIVDAMSSGSPAGSLQVFDVARHALPCRSRNSSTHAFGLYEALELARVLGRMPKKISVYGIEGKNFSLGETVSPDLQKRVHDLAQKILREFEHA